MRDDNWLEVMCIISGQKHGSEVASLLLLILVARWPGFSQLQLLVAAIKEDSYTQYTLHCDIHCPGHKLFTCFDTLYTLHSDNKRLYNNNNIN